MRSTAFAGLVAAVLVLVSVNRTFGAPGLLRGLRRNVPLAGILGLVSIAFALLFGVPAIAGLFRFALLDLRGMAAVAILALALTALLGLLKHRFRDALVN